MYSVIALKILQQVEYFIDYKNALIKLLFRLMIQNKNKGANKPPFPFSAYVLRSYSSEPSDNARSKMQHKNSN